MTLRALHRGFLQELRKLYNDHEAEVITGMVFREMLNTGKSELIMYPDNIADPASIKKLNDALAQLQLHKPVQYVTGFAWFCGLRFKVSPAVLIPRPETEELVHSIVGFSQTGERKKMLDIGTGSGCIPVTVKKNIPALEMDALDISAAALDVARENANIHGTQVNYILQDFLNESSWNSLGVYDIISSNPPYIPELEKDKLDPNVAAYEPHEALFVPDNDAIIFYERIAAFAKGHLAADGKIFMETHEDYAVNVVNFFRADGYEAGILLDFYGKERMIVATRSR